VANQGLRELVAAAGAKLDELNRLGSVDNLELVAVADR
jgi:hypothetical protein